MTGYPGRSTSATVVHETSDTDVVIICPVEDDVPMQDISCCLRDRLQEWQKPGKQRIGKRR